MQIEKRFQIEKATASDDTRPVLTGVFISEWQGKPVAVAADGYIMAVVPITLDDGDVTGLLPANHIVSARKASGRLDTMLVLAEKTTRSIDMVERPRNLEGTFPDFVRIIPKVEEATPAQIIGVNPELLVRLGKALGSEGKGGLAILQTKGADYPFLVKCAADLHNGNWTEAPFGVIMPMHVNAFVLPVATLKVAA